MVPTMFLTGRNVPKYFNRARCQGRVRSSYGFCRACTAPVWPRTPEIYPSVRDKISQLNANVCSSTSCWRNTLDTKQTELHTSAATMDLSSGSVDAGDLVNKLNDQDKAELSHFLQGESQRTRIQQRTSKSTQSALTRTADHLCGLAP